MLGAGLLAGGPAQAALDDRLVAGGIGLAALFGLTGLAAGLWALILQRRSLREQRRLMEMVERSLASHGNGPAPRTGTGRPGEPEAEAPSRRGLQVTEPDVAAGAPAKAPDARIIDEADEPAANVIRLSAEVTQAARPVADTAAASSLRTWPAGAIEALGEGRFDIALEPMISISKSRAVGFDVHATVGADDGFMYRMASEPRAGARLAFEAALVRKAAAVACQQFEESGEEMPLYVPVSASLLQDSASLDSVLKLYAGDSRMSRLLILSVPVHLMTGANRKQAPALDRLRDGGIKLAAEGWLGGLQGVETLKGHGVDCVKITANRLLEREKLRPKDLDADTIVAACADAGILVAAIEVNTDEEAISLIDIGVDVMSGLRFNGPRRLKPGFAAGKGARAGS
ncbi:EAL domain-containing protein [Zhengella sp. ZM62]|uniref:EAL domain-containing protein n=1 Tax=Zhengella sedimenti TaxID=3390035 RepID=UPI0039770CF9